MVARRLFGMLGGCLAVVGVVAVPASADAVQRNATYRIFWEAVPAYRVVPGTHHTVWAVDSETGWDHWVLTPVGGSFARPIFQIRNVASDLCLAPALRRAASSDVEMAECGTGTEQTWYIDPIGPSHSIALVADPARKIYANKTTGTAGTLLEGVIADTSQSRWIFRRI
ncbi:RICIN domain-containing protein [Nocardia sp. CDC159]|uniref:RICIN domain-containing protein n=1 Tax=Nocardia pulmonis TaxID=2951408 RepID=A0A9X2ECY1_9NOCA|nr:MULTISPECIES: RICIN domain-containing protein [Nocardia]MCM6778056.1 RICIN domain-containing protein [Nocardia pulmonis]MCM6790945.1 RICIN domain-containing protein [Nocardia sp. CDC159]